MALVSIEYKYFWAPSIVFRDRNKDVQPRTADWRYETAEMAASHFLQVQVKSQVISLQVQVKSQVISVQVQVKSQVNWSDVKSSQVTSHLVQTQVKSQVSLSKYKSSRTYFFHSRHKKGNIIKSKRK